MEDYYAAIRLAPGDAVAHYSRGAGKAELGDLAGAMSDFDVADAHYNRWLTHVAMGRRHRDGRWNSPPSSFYMSDSLR